MARRIFKRHCYTDTTLRIIDLFFKPDCLLVLSNPAEELALMEDQI